MKSFRLKWYPLDDLSQTKDPKDTLEYLAELFLELKELTLSEAYDGLGIG